MIQNKARVVYKTQNRKLLENCTVKEIYYVYNGYIVKLIELYVLFVVELTKLIITII